MQPESDSLELVQLSMARRRSEIVKQLQLQQEVAVAELSHRFGVSRVTIRRDLEDLESRNLVRRVHGGARALDAGPFHVGLTQNVDAKRRIGQAAASLIGHGQSVLLDCGTTVLEVARRIPRSLLNSNSLTVVTRALYIASELRDYPNTRLIVLGGLYKHGSDHFVGPQVMSALHGLRVDTLVTGTDGVTLEAGFTTYDILESGLFERMADIADRVVVVADSSKIGARNLQVQLPLDRVDVLVTDSDAPEDFLDGLRDIGIDVVVVSSQPE